MDAFQRTQMLLGAENMEKLKHSSVLIFGIGGVGSYTVEALARSGVGRILMVDKDVIDITNINRQIHATHNTVGQSKTEAMKERIFSINPEAEVKTFNMNYTPENSDEFFLSAGRIDYIIDAIDTVTSKIDLIIQGKKRNIPIISAMGAGNKLDPTKFEVTDIYKTSICPLAKVMRHELRKRGIDSLKVVYSKEEAIKPQKLPDSDESNMHRRAVPGSVAFVPSVCGLIIASAVIKDLLLIRS